MHIVLLQLQVQLPGVWLLSQLVDIFLEITSGVPRRHPNISQYKLLNCHSKLVSIFLLWLQDYMTEFVIFDLFIFVADQETKVLFTYNEI